MKFSESSGIVPCDYAMLIELHCRILSPRTALSRMSRLCKRRKILPNISHRLWQCYMSDHSSGWNWCYFQIIRCGHISKIYIIPLYLHSRSYIIDPEYYRKSNSGLFWLGLVSNHHEHPSNCTDMWTNEKLVIFIRKCPCKCSIMLNLGSNNLRPVSGDQSSICILN